MLRKPPTWLGFVILLAASLVACSGGLLKPHIPKRCDQIVDEVFLTLPLGTPPSEVLQRRVVEGYGLAPEEVRAGEGTLSWERDDSSYSISHTPTGGVLAERWWDSHTARPTAEDVLRCFGNPTMVDAYTYQDITPGFRLQLWYLDRGDKSFMVECGFFVGSDLPWVRAEHTEIPTHYDGSFPISRVVTGDMTYLLSSPWAKLKPWPGNAEEIIIEQMRRVNR
jgi:hypothetical protein